MDEEIKKLLDEEIKHSIQDLSNLPIGSDRTAAVDDLTKLYKLKLEEGKTRLNHEENIRKCTFENDLNRDQLKEQTKDRYFKLGMDAAKLVLPLLFYAVWMRKGLKFEESGSFTSATFRGLINCFKPTQK